MDRRQFLAAATGAATGWLTGCASQGEDRTSPATTAGTPQETTTTTAIASGETTNDTRLARHGRPPTICEEEIRADPGIYAIVEPAFASDWNQVTPDRIYRPDDDVTGLLEDQTVIGIATSGVARAYPLSVLWHHEIVNDTIGTGSAAPGPVLVTYCPLCRSGMVASRVLDGTPTPFLVSGLLWKPPRVYQGVSEKEGHVFGAETTGGETTAVRHAGNLVMYDEATGSYWSQMLARAICGPKRGETLHILPSTVATWREWREAYPDTEVLLPPPRSTTVRPGEATTDTPDR